MRKRSWALLLILGLLLGGCGRTAAPMEQPDPYAGMVQVDSGYGTKMWVKDYDDVPVNTLEPALFSRSGSYITYTGTQIRVLRGIDVSEHQGTIDWNAVAEDGVTFAFLRLGYRGYSQGGLFEDPYFRDNLSGALSAGIQVGLYFFSQAVTTAEAEEEAAFLLQTLEDCPEGAVTLPIIYDWETITAEDARTKEMDGATLTACAAAFCEKIRAAGYDAGVYAYRYLAYFLYDLPSLNGYKLWIGAVGDAPDFYYAHDIWQYSDTGRVAGIEGDVDLDLMFLPSGRQTAGGGT